MELKDITALAATMRAAGVVRFAGTYLAVDEHGHGKAHELTIELGPALLAAKPAPAQVARERERPRESLPPELAKHMTADLKAELTATLED